MAKAAQNIRWVPQEQKNAKGECNSIGERNGNIYQIFRGADGLFTATHFNLRDLMRTTLAEGVSGAMAWRKCVDHHNENYIPPTA
jgi:hypothetical protein